ncbi:MAG TPA: hypothetical protein VFU49_11620 [Ktedonobacteraceae bacterium]|nr:hypothetical protein [Ktedonobacteraceae bacterium]
MYNSQRWLLPIGILLMVLLAGCGHNDGSASGSGAGASPAPTGSGNGVTPTPTGAGSNVTPAPTQPPVQSPTENVILQVGAASYQAGSTVHIIIKNQSKQTINFADHKTNCTVLTVQRAVGDSWLPMAPCRLMIVTRLHSLNAGASMDVSISTTGPWSAGVYRARLDYRSGSETTPGTAASTYSSEFRLT